MKCIHVQNEPLTKYKQKLHVTEHSFIHWNSTFYNSKEGNSISRFHSVRGRSTLIVTIISMGNIYYGQLWRISNDWGDFIMTAAYNFLATSVPCDVGSWNTSGNAGKCSRITNICIHNRWSWRCCRRHWSNNNNIPLQLHVYSILD